MNTILKIYCFAENQSLTFTAKPEPAGKVFSAGFLFLLIQSVTTTQFGTLLQKRSQPKFKKNQEKFAKPKSCTYICNRLVS
jgi:hypothetical protein